MTGSSCGHRRLGRAVSFALSIALPAAGCSPKAPPPADAVRPVKTAVVAAGGEPHVRSFPGKVEAARQVQLAFQVPGLLVDLPAREGQRVAKGEVVARLRPDEFEARLKTLQGQLDQARAVLRAVRSGERPEQLLRLEANVRAAEAKLTNARTELSRNEQLVRASAGARADLDIARTTYRVAREEHQAAIQLLEKGTFGREEDVEAKEGAVRGLEGRVVEAKIQLDDTTLRAPYDGVIAQRFVEPNQNVRAKDPVVKFQDADEIEVAVDVPETVMAADLRAADIVRLVAEFSGAPGVEFPVRITEVAQRADPVTQTFKVRAALQAPPGVNILPGMSANVTLTYRRAGVLGDRLLVPVAAVVQEPAGGSVAWVVGPDGTVGRRPVILGAAAGGRVEVLTGLQPGDRIAVAGVRFLRDGMAVRDLGDALGGGPP